MRVNKQLPGPLSYNIAIPNPISLNCAAVILYIFKVSRELYTKKLVEGII